MMATMEYERRPYAYGGNTAAVNETQLRTINPQGLQVSAETSRNSLQAINFEASPSYHVVSDSRGSYVIYQPEKEEALSSVGNNQLYDNQSRTLDTRQSHIVAHQSGTQAVELSKGLSKSQIGSLPVEFYDIQLAYNEHLVNIPSIEASSLPEERTVLHPPQADGRLQSTGAPRETVAAPAKQYEPQLAQDYYRGPDGHIVTPRAPQAQPRIEVRDIQREVIKYVPKIEYKYVEREVKVLSRQKTPMPRVYPVDVKFIVPKFDDRHIPWVVSQAIVPEIKEVEQYIDVEVKKYVPYMKVIDVYVPRPVTIPIKSDGKAEQKEVPSESITDQQLRNSFIQLNPHLVQLENYNSEKKGVFDQAVELSKNQASEYMLPIPEPVTSNLISTKTFTYEGYTSSNKRLVKYGDDKDRVKGVDVAQTESVFVETAGSVPEATNQELFEKKANKVERSAVVQEKFEENQYETVEQEEEEEETAIVEQNYEPQGVQREEQEYVNSPEEEEEEEDEEEVQVDAEDIEGANFQEVAEDVQEVINEEAENDYEAAEYEVGAEVVEYEENAEDAPLYEEAEYVEAENNVAENYINDEYENNLEESEVIEEGTRYAEDDEENERNENQGIAYVSA